VAREVFAPELDHGGFFSSTPVTACDVDWSVLTIGTLALGYCAHRMESFGISIDDLAQPSGKSLSP